MRPPLLRHIEALLFSAGEALDTETIHTCLSEALSDDRLTVADIEHAIAELQTCYDAPDHTFQLQLSGGGWQLLTKADYYPTLSRYFKERSGKRLSRSAIETLSIVAYRQPVTRADVEAIRGVNADYALNKLLERELISIIGRSDGPGKPLLYATSPQFMDYFGLADIRDLPKLRELKLPDNAIGSVENGELQAPPRSESE